MNYKRTLGWVWLVPAIIWAQEKEAPSKSYTTQFLEGEILLDGRLDDEAWSRVPWGGDFVGHDPEYLAEPSQQTQFKILYDAKFIYVGIRAFDTSPEKIVKRMSRRDGFDGDWVEINIDSYNDKRTAFSFSASVSGVKGDEFVSNNGDNWDATWDPIWYLKTSVDEQGWVAEFKIPLSQLRFADKNTHVWGIQFTRRLFREQERSTWQPIDPNAPGWVHLFGELNGIAGIKPQKQLEVLPYVVTSLETYEADAENPFRDSGRAFGSNIGVDTKIGITSDITLDLTLNPDFGQVNADPSQVNLSAFQLFFREQRPFFLEGSNILSMRPGGGPNNLFYSRRIGARPQGTLPDDVAYADIPNQTKILGALKLTGKNARGFSWGLSESLTGIARAEVLDTAGVIRKEKIEPLTNYFASRFQQDLNAGNTVFGAMFTRVDRINNNVNELDLLHDNAMSWGLDIDHNLFDRKYGFTARVGGSQVNGSQGAIYATQTEFRRSFQRTDNTYKELDSTRTSLTGTFGWLSFGKRSGNWRWAAGTNYRSPELELNDIGFLRQTDNINSWIWNSYRINKPTKLFRNQRYDFYHDQDWDFGGVRIGTTTNFNMNVQFLNFWGFESGLGIQGKSISNADLRGGPSITYPGGKEWWYWIGTNDQKAVRVTFNNWYYWGDNNFARAKGFNMNVTLRPMDALRLTLSPGATFRDNGLQYIYNDNESDGIYLLGRIQQTIYRVSLRANYNITPNLTIEYWGQPFIASGYYSDFKRVTASNAELLEDRYLPIHSDWLDDTSSTFLVDEDLDMVTDYSFSDPNFNQVNFLSNMVVRWEYIPGSELFLVWSMNGSYYDQERDQNFRGLSSQLLDLNGAHTFLIKYTYRFVR